MTSNILSGEIVESEQELSEGKEFREREGFVLVGRGATKARRE